MKWACRCGLHDTMWASEKNVSQSLSFIRICQFSDLQIWTPLTRSQCRVSHKQMTVQDYGPLDIWYIKTFEFECNATNKWPNYIRWQFIKYQWFTVMNNTFSFIKSLSDNTILILTHKNQYFDKVLVWTGLSGKILMINSSKYTNLHVWTRTTLSLSYWRDLKNNFFYDTAIYSILKEHSTFVLRWNHGKNIYFFSHIYTP